MNVLAYVGPTLVIELPLGVVDVFIPFLIILAMHNLNL